MGRDSGKIITGNEINTLDFPETESPGFSGTGPVQGTGNCHMTSTVIPPYVFGSKTGGRGHQIKKIPCQDAFFTEVVLPSHVVTAVSDGLGSARYSDLGAQCAVESAVNTVTSLMAWGETDYHTLLKEGILNSRKALFEKAARVICPVRDLACTILIIIASRDGVAVAHIGDGAVVIKGSGTIRIFSEPENSEYVNVVVPLTSDDWEKALRIRVSHEPVECIAAFTDGLQNAALKKSDSTYTPFEAFFNPLFSYALQVEDPAAADGDIHDMLKSDKIGTSSDDDMTLVISVLNKNGEKEQK
jgi:hypothetical protein